MVVVNGGVVLGLAAVVVVVVWPVCGAVTVLFSCPAGLSAKDILTFYIRRSNHRTSWPRVSHPPRPIAAHFNSMGLDRPPLGKGPGGEIILGMVHAQREAYAKNKEEGFENMSLDRSRL